MYAIRDGWLVHPSSLVRGVRWTVHQVHSDERGSFTEAAVDSILQMVAGHHIRQVNVSISKPRVLRGLHVHRSQTDFWYVASGMAEVVVQQSDMAHERRTLFPGHGVIIPPGIGHGFLALSDLILVYAVSAEYNQEHPDEYEYQALNVTWSIPVADTIQSDRDRMAGVHFPVLGLEDSQLRTL